LPFYRSRRGFVGRGSVFAHRIGVDARIVVMARGVFGHSRFR
jgi:hypothetical protein